jgi:putative transposase
MGKPYSMDLRERVVAAVDPSGLSCHRAAAQFGVGVNTAILWVRCFRETGSVASGQMGGHKPKKISGKHRDWLLERTKARDFTLRGPFRSPLLPCSDRKSLEIASLKMPLGRCLRMYMSLL